MKPRPEIGSRSASGTAPRNSVSPVSGFRDFDFDFDFDFVSIVVDLDDVADRAL
jgi:hypothetical protein